VPADADFSHLILADLDAFFIFVGIQDRLHLQSTLGRRCANQIHHCFVVQQGLSLPGQAEEGEPSVFDLVPLAPDLLIQPTVLYTARFVQRLTGHYDNYEKASWRTSLRSSSTRPCNQLSANEGPLFSS
jgi:hypothetical protein